MNKTLIFLCILFLAYLPLSFSGLSSIRYESDEFFYFAMASEMLEGRMPYRDFFAAHMPLMLYSIAGAFMVFGKTVSAGKLVPLASSFLLLVFTYLSGERMSRNQGAVAALLLFFSPGFQQFTHLAYGIMLVNAVAMAAFYAHLTGRKTVSGFLAILAAFTRLNSLPFAACLVFFNRREKSFFKGIMLGLPLLTFLLVPGFLENTVFYHLGKTGMPLDLRMQKIVSYSLVHWLPVAAFLYAAFSAHESKGSFREVLTFSIVLTASVLIQKNVFGFYLLLPLPFICLAGGLSLKPRIDGGAGKFIVVLIVLWISLNLSAYKAAYQENRPLEDVRELMLEKTSPGERVFCLSVGCRYLTFTTGTAISADLIDVADERVKRQADKFGGILLDGLSQADNLAVVDLKEVEAYRGMGVDTKEFTESLFNGFQPVNYFYSTPEHEGGGEWLNDINLIVVFEKNKAYREDGGYPVKNHDPTVHYLETLVSYDDELKPYARSRASQITGQQNTRVYVPDYLLGENNIGNAVFTDRDYTRLLSGSRNALYQDGLNTHAWNIEDTERHAVIMTASTRDGEILSYGHLTYSREKQVFVFFRLFSRLSDGKNPGFLPAYTQELISPEKYGELKG